MRLIGIATQRRSAEGGLFLGLVGAYMEALAAQGLAYVLVPPQGEAALERLLRHLDGILLPGGGDVDPGLYGEEPLPELGEVDPERDGLEVFLARYAAEKGLPLLGVCRGVQVLNVALGGSLHQDLGRAGFALQHYQKSPPAWGALAHRVELTGESPLTALFPPSFRVNSYHHQGVKALGRGLRPAAFSPDGLVEAVFLGGHPLYLGVQWHPELLRAHWPLFGLLRRA
ncbi:gamma-glutamyl-gamma-aminobutyrate hydrolase family protein [Thermus islandicus]|uniref:gamma-glutamyl-gamma-aminobutyrate hydrolase family protein n=1 Tax=Thermus islandicus TaxID=540988 RepID=UPI0003B632DB|nr:gamma-glutamyl-gamma-aminobutyrate hydrolase family protein [Thermus islandicus]